MGPVGKGKEVRGGVSERAKVEFKQREGGLTRGGGERGEDGVGRGKERGGRDGREGEEGGN